MIACYCSDENHFLFSIKFLLKVFNIKGNIYCLKLLFPEYTAGELTEFWLEKQIVHGNQITNHLKVDHGLKYSDVTNQIWQISKCFQIPNIKVE